MSSFSRACLGFLSLGVIVLLYLATVDTARNLSPQGCRMSYMSPSYVLQKGLDTSWSPLAQRYSLWLYREVGWDSGQLQGVPVLFIPGNAGSSHQVRSIASSATRQFYMSPQVVAPDFAARSLKPLDFFAVDFNEDLSAFHGSTLNSQITYTSSAIAYILSLYPANTTVIIMGHSMGGVVATSLLPSSDISTIITMSTPHTVPPARFDSRIDDIYRKEKRVLDSDPTPVVSLCGGATDMMIPSESCILQQPSSGDIFRRTVFTSALEGAWTGVGHREMVWCHQVRWRVARAALEVGAVEKPNKKGVILDRWLRDGHTLPSAISNQHTSKISLHDSTTFEILPNDIDLILKNPRGSRTYLLPLPAKNSVLASSVKFVLYTSQGSVNGISPANPNPLRVSVFLCSLSPAPEETVPLCSSLKPSSLRLIPNPDLQKMFPVPEEGSDESEGVVLYEADIPTLSDDTEGAKWLAVRVANADGRGWVKGGFLEENPIINPASTLSLLLGGASINIHNKGALRTRIMFPHILSNALIVYRVVPRTPSGGPACNDTMLPSLMMHTSHPSETHHFPIGGHDRPILLHTHHPAPFVPRNPDSHKGLEFTIYSSGIRGCNVELHGLTIKIDWSATLGRWASRYPTTLISWAVGVVAIVIYGAWGISDEGGAMLTVPQALTHFIRRPFRRLLLASFLASFIPLPEDYYLGNSGESLFAPIAPLVLTIATGLVCISWWLLCVLMWPIEKLGKLLFGRRREEFSVRRSTLLSMCLIFLLIFLFIPWQVAYLGCWIIHLYTCASSMRIDSLTPAVSTIPLIRVHDTDDNVKEESMVDTQIHESQHEPTQTRDKIDNRNYNMHILLLMTWFLPLAAPVLAVWVRTLVTAGLTTPFDGDHFFLNVAPFLVLVDFASWNTGKLFERQSFETTLPVRWCLAVLAATAFVIGSRQAYSVFDAGKLAVGIITLIRIGRRYWGGVSWSTKDR